MTLLSGSVSLMRHRVVGAIDGPFWDRIDDGIRQNIFHPVETGGETVGVGWVSVHDLTDAAFVEPYATGDYIALSLRVDTKRVSSRTVEVELKQRAQGIIKTTGEARISKQQHKELRDTVLAELRQQAPPTIQTFDLMWSYTTATVYSSALSVKTNELVTGIFKKSFGLDLVPVIPFIAACESITGTRSGPCVRNPLGAIPSAMMDIKEAS